ncbi:hypothetical protein ACHAWF_016298 [Thalassiosira exigua]
MPESVATEVASAMVGGMFSASALYPLEVLKTRMQAETKAEKRDEKEEGEGTVFFGSQRAAIFHRRGRDVQLASFENRRWRTNSSTRRFAAAGEEEPLPNEQEGEAFDDTNATSSNPTSAFLEERARAQLKARYAAAASEGMGSYAKLMWEREGGIAPFYSGVVTSAVQSATEKALYFFAYTFLKNGELPATSAVPFSEGTSFQSASIVGGSSLCGRVEAERERSAGLYILYAAPARRRGLPIAWRGDGHGRSVWSPWYVGVTGDANIGAVSNLILGCFAEWSHLPVTLPIDCVTTAIQTDDKNRGALVLLGTILSEKGIGGFYKGIEAYTVLCLKPAIQYTVYEQVKRVVLAARRADAPRGRGRSAVAASAAADSLSAAEAFFLGMVARVVATMLTYPYLRAKVMLQSTYKNAAVKPTIPQMIAGQLKEGGVWGLYQGIGPELTRGVFSAALMMMVKERIGVVVRALIDGRDEERRRIERGGGREEK